MQSRDPKSRLKKILVVLFGVLFGLMCIAGIFIAIMFYESQIQYHGKVVIAGLIAPVEVEWDRLGIPTITGANRLDVARAMGFLHAQQRFFQMDLLRRGAAGELSELFGTVTVGADRQQRIHQFRQRAQSVFERLTKEERDLLQAYTEGVNAGLASLHFRPVEYFILRTQPKPWSPEDSILVVDSLFLSLEDHHGDRAYAGGILKAELPSAIYSFLMENGSTWDSSIDGSSAPLIPVPQLGVNMSYKMTMASHNSSDPVDASLAGSNSWVVSGTHTASGQTMLANDLHLRLSVPNIWYRAKIIYHSRDGRERSVVGATIPGLPLMVVGSNGSVAWGFTNSGIDTTDLIIMETDADHVGMYKVPGGWAKIQEDEETILVKNRPSVLTKVQKTIWGPIIEDRKFYGHAIILKWAAYEPIAINFKLIELEEAGDVTDALSRASRAKLPSVNLLLADSTGNIAWTIIGYLPNRKNYDGTVPVSFADGNCQWIGDLDRAVIPSIINPPGGRLWNSNNRSVRMPSSITNGGYANGARAKQIEIAISSREKFIPQDFLDIQRDDRALFYQRWNALLISVLSDAKSRNDARKQELLGLLEKWDGRASIDSAAFVFVRDFRHVLSSIVIESYLNLLKDKHDINLSYFDFEEPIWATIQARQQSSAQATGYDWQAILDGVVDTILSDSDHTSGQAKPLEARRWGDNNRLAMKHPLSSVIPIIGRCLNMPSVPLAGENNMPLVAASNFGASLRMVVSPGSESNGIFEMPGGESGNPFSRHYRDQLNAWLKGEPTALVPSDTVDRLTLIPTFRKRSGDR